MLFQTDMMWKIPLDQGKDQEVRSGEERRSRFKEEWLSYLPVSNVTCQVEKTNPFLYADWCEKIPSELKDGETLILASQHDLAEKATSMLNGEHVDIIPNSDHEEADIRIFYLHC